MPPQRDARNCPYCRKRRSEAVATLPYVRGHGLGARFGTRTLVGCATCVRKGLLLETARSALDGWSSPAAALANPVLIAYGLARALVVMRDPERVGSILRTAGAPETARPPEPVRIGYGLAAAMIAVDGRIAREEVVAASTIGKCLFPDFDEAEFARVVAAHRTLPDVGDLAALLKDVAPPDIKAAVYRYLVAIATSDDEVAPEEHALLATVAANFGIEGPGDGVDAAV